jgi:hypothetical protein
MSSAVPEGAVMPEGIEVDEAAAYFGVVDTSDAVYQMMAMGRIEAMENFFAKLSDIVLTPGEFDFEAASQRMQCEGGEIYYLVAGHLSLLSITDPLLNYLGLENSQGEGAGNCQRESSGADFEALKKISDPMNVLKLLAIAYTTGGAGEVTRYVNEFEALVANPGSNEIALLSIANELIASLDVAGHALPITTLASGNAASSAVVALPTTTTQTTKEEVKSVPIPKTTNVPIPSKESVPLPVETSKVTLPEIEEEIEQPIQVNIENQNEVEKATQDAFAGAFSVVSEEKKEPVVEEVIVEEVIVEEVIAEEVQPEVVQEIVEETPQQIEPESQPIAIVPEESEPEKEEFVSAAEHFIAADTDESGQLSIEELAEATGTTIEEATALHAQADTDGDGSVSLSEFMSSAAAEKAAALPRPVAPVRKPLGEKSQPIQHQEVAIPQPRPIQNQQPQQGWNQQPQQQQPQQGWNQQPQRQQQPQQGWNQQPQRQQQPQQGWNQQPQQQPQQGWNQPQSPIQPTIRSGVLCRGCGIGLDPNWRHCPICGSPNAGF